MDIDRRSLMKGMLAGGALVALGTPPWAFADSPVRRPKRCLLLLGGTSTDELFENGAQAASAGMTCKDMRIVKLKGGLLAGTDRIVQLLEESRKARWIAIMDDAGAVIFLELARTAGSSCSPWACMLVRPVPLISDMTWPLPRRITAWEACWPRTLFKGPTVSPL